MNTPTKTVSFRREKAWGFFGVFGDKIGSLAFLSIPLFLSVDVDFCRLLHEAPLFMSLISVIATTGTKYTGIFLPIPSLLLLHAFH